MASLQQWTVTHLMCTFGLVILNVFVVFPMFVDTHATATVNTSTNISHNVTFAQGCLPGSSGILDAIVDWASQLGVIGLIFGGDQGDTCIGGFNLLSTNVLVGAIMAAVGGAVLLAGFLTSGSSRGGISAVGYGIVIGGALTAALGLALPIFRYVPYIGEAVAIMWAATGYVLTLMTGFNLLSGSGS